MSQTFRVCYMRMWVEPNIVEIGGSALGHLSYKTILLVRCYFWWVQVPGIHVFVASFKRNGNIKGLGQVYFIVTGVVFYGGNQIGLLFNFPVFLGSNSTSFIPAFAETTIYYFKLIIKRSEAIPSAKNLPFLVVSNFPSSTTNKP